MFRWSRSPQPQDPPPLFVPIFLAPLISIIQLEYEAPNARIHFFTGTLTLQGQGGGGSAEGGGAGGSRDVPVDQSNLLLRGARLRNTKWALGVVAYTGRESKIAQNARSVPSKQSNLDKVGGQGGRGDCLPVSS